MLTFLSGSADIKSGSGSLATIFELRNTTSGALTVSWIDGSGVERVYGQVVVGGTYFQQTISTHAWVVRDSKGVALFKFVASESGLITVTAGGPNFQGEIAGTSGPDSLVGTAGDDRFAPGNGTDTIDGGAGNDLVRLPGASTDYDIKLGTTPGSFVLSSAAYGVKTLLGVESVQFNSAPYSPLDLTRLSPLLSYEVVPLRKTGDTTKRVDLVFVAEGYTLAQRQKFLDDAAAMVESMLGDSNLRLNTPLSVYSGLFNVTAVFVPSAQSGIDQHLKGITVDTAFDAITYGADARLGYGDANRVNFVLDRAVSSTGRDMVVVLMNTSIYTAAGGAQAWVAASNPSAFDVVLHELGHSYAGLQDEYVDAALGQGALPTTLNSVHLSLSSTVVPWSRWLGFQDELGTVGAYEGGLYRSQGVWRATMDSKMLSLGRPFSAPQKEAFIGQFYKQVGDYLSLGFDGRDAPRAAVPDSLPVRLEWQLQGKVVGTGLQPDARALASSSTAVMQTPTAQRLVLTSEDNSGMVRDPAIITSSRQIETLDVLLGSTANDRFSGTEKNDVVIAGDGMDFIQGLGGDDVLYGNGGHDTLVGGAGADTLDGGEGLDVAQWSGPRGRYTITGGAAQWSVADTSSADGIDALRDVERLKFSDGLVALDLRIDQAAGQALLLIGAVIGREATLAKRVMMGSVIDLFDQGFTLEVLAGAVMRLPIWAGVLTVTDSAADKAAHLLRTVYGRAATAAELADATRSVEVDATGTLLAKLALTPVNVAQVGLVGLAQTGFDFPLPGGG